MGNSWKNFQHLWTYQWEIIDNPQICWERRKYFAVSYSTLSLEVRHMWQGWLRVPGTPFISSRTRAPRVSSPCGKAGRLVRRESSKRIIVTQTWGDWGESWTSLCLGNISFIFFDRYMLQVKGNSTYFIKDREPHLIFVFSKVSAVALLSYGRKN